MISDDEGFLVVTLNGFEERSGVTEVCPLLHRNMQRFRGGPVFKAHRLCVSLNSRLESNKEEEEV